MAVTPQSFMIYVRCSIKIKKSLGGLHLSLLDPHDYWIYTEAEFEQPYFYEM